MSGIVGTVYVVCACIELGNELVSTDSQAVATPHYMYTISWYQLGVSSPTPRGGRGVSSTVARSSAVSGCISNSSSACWVWLSSPLWPWLWL